MDNINLTFNEVATYLVVANTIVGLLFGLFPLFAGLRLNNRRYGIIGFLGSIIGGALLGFFLSFPVAMIFNWLILRRAQTAENSTLNAIDQPAA